MTEDYEDNDHVTLVILMDYEDYDCVTLVILVILIILLVILCYNPVDLVILTIRNPCSCKKQEVQL